MSLYDYEQEFTFVGDFSNDVFAAYAGTADPDKAKAVLVDAIKRMKSVMAFVTCPTMSIRAQTEDGHVFKVTLARS